MPDDGVGVGDRVLEMDWRVEAGRETDDPLSWDIEAEVIRVFRRRRAECLTLSFHLAEALAQSFDFDLTSSSLSSRSACTR